MSWLGLTLTLAGCGLDPAAKEEGRSKETTEHDITYNAAFSKATDVSGVADATTEENALKTYFKGKELLSKAYFAKDEAKAKQYAAEAERCFERSLRFYAPDIEAMAAGKKPVHSSANWEFLKALHETWSKAIGLSGKRMAIKERIDGNVKDAWALAVVSRMVQDESDEERRRKLIAEKFSEIRNALVSGDAYAERLAARKEAVGEKKQAKAIAVASVATTEKAAAAKSSVATSLVAKPVAPALAATDVKLADGLVTEDPVTGKAALSVANEAGKPAAAAKVAAVENPRPVEEKGRPLPAGFTPHFSSPAKLYIGDRLYTLPPTPGKLYIGDRIYTLPAQEKP